jgi:hypothetical protein
VRRNGLIAALVAATLAMAPATAGASTNLVKNGDFEKPPVSFYLVVSTGQSFSGWKVVGASGDVGVVSDTFTQNGFTFPAASGRQWLDLTGLDNAATGVSQTVKNLAVGTSYTLTFSVGNVSDPGGIFGTTSTVDVRVNGHLLMTAVNTKGAGTTKQVWKKFTKTFVATKATAAITFLNGDPPSDGNNGLDAVALSPAP